MDPFFTTAASASSILPPEQPPRQSRSSVVEDATTVHIRAKPALSRTDPVRSRERREGHDDNPCSDPANGLCRNDKLRSSTSSFQRTSLKSHVLPPKSRSLICWSAEIIGTACSGTPTAYSRRTASLGCPRRTFSKPDTPVPRAFSDMSSSSMESFAESVSQSARSPRSQSTGPFKLATFKRVIDGHFARAAQSARIVSVEIPVSDKSIERQFR
mmetsp:Transcript_32088/g.99387  ORF Transcript_32088/g.99387 Transcript_32088/m.99387 type:complete len:214 (-) Transcript_32088:234-875(-)